MKKLFLFLFLPSICLGAGTLRVNQGSSGGTITVTAGSSGGSTGDIDGVTAGTNITGGGTSGTVTINLADPITLSSGTISRLYVSSVVYQNGTIQVSSPTAAATTSPGGNPSNIQYKNGSGNFAGDNGLQYDSAVSSLTLNGAAGIFGSLLVDRPDLGTGAVNRSALSFNPGSGNPVLSIRPYNSGATSSVIDLQDTSGISFAYVEGNPLSSHSFSVWLASGNGAAFSPMTRFDIVGADGRQTFYNPSGSPMVQFDPVGNSSFTIPVALSTITISKQLIDSAGSNGSLNQVLTRSSSGPAWTTSSGGGSNLYPTTGTPNIQYGFSASTGVFSSSVSVNQMFIQGQSPGVAHIVVGSSQIITGLVLSTEMASTAVTPGSYTNTNLTVDQQGRITTASNGTDNSGYAVQPATVSFQLNQGLSVSTIAVSNSITLSTIATPSGTEGQIWMDGATNSEANFAGGIINRHGIIFTSTGLYTYASSAVTSTMTTNNPGGIGTLTLPANFFTSGKMIEVVAMGTLASASTPNLTTQLKLGTTSMATTGARAILPGITTLTSGVIDIKFLITCYTTGSAGTFFTQGSVLISSDTTPNQPYQFMFGQTATVTLNTTVSNTINLTFLWGTGSSSNSVRISNYYIKEDD